MFPKIPGSWNGSLPAGDTIHPAHGGNVATVTFVWNISTLAITQSGAGYAVAPAVTFSSGAATATTALGSPSSGTQPSSLSQPTLVLAGPVGFPGQINASKPGAYFNFDISSPIQPDDAIQQTLVAGPT